MRKLQFLVPQGFDGKSLKVFLRGFCGISHQLMVRQKAVPNGIQVNGLHTHVNAIVHTGDLVCLCLPDGKKEIPAVSIPLDIVWEDADLLVVNKPAFMPVYPTPGHDRDSLANALAAYFQNQNQPFSFHPVYRLDKNTTGLLVLAKHSYAAAALSSGVEKEYTAICEGKLKGSGTIRAPICLKEGHRIQREVGEGVQAKMAITHWHAISVHENQHTLLKIYLETGRTHQIRVHFSHIGHPLAGDDMYGGSRKWISRQALCCTKVKLQHPVTGESFQWACPLPRDMQFILQEKNVQKKFMEKILDL